jgi:hypothetical protein
MSDLDSPSCTLPFTTSNPQNGQAAYHEQVCYLYLISLLPDRSNVLQSTPYIDSVSLKYYLQNPPLPCFTAHCLPGFLLCIEPSMVAKSVRFTNDTNIARTGGNVSSPSMPGPFGHRGQQQSRYTLPYTTTLPQSAATNFGPICYPSYSGYHPNMALPTQSNPYSNRPGKSKISTLLTLGYSFLLSLK